MHKSKEGRRSFQRTANRKSYIRRSGTSIFVAGSTIRIMRQKSRDSIKTVRGVSRRESGLTLKGSDKSRISRPGPGPGLEPIELNSGPIHECVADESETTHTRLEKPYEVWCNNPPSCVIRRMKHGSLTQACNVEKRQPVHKCMREVARARALSWAT